MCKSFTSCSRLITTPAHNLIIRFYGGLDALPDYQTTSVWNDGEIPWVGLDVGWFQETSQPRRKNWHHLDKCRCPARRQAVESMTSRSHLSYWGFQHMPLRPWSRIPAGLPQTYQCTYTVNTSKGKVKKQKMRKRMEKGRKKAEKGVSRPHAGCFAL